MTAVDPVRHQPAPLRADAAGFDVQFEVLRDATARLLASVADLDDAAARAPSLLPGWTRAHVVTHLARNADGCANLVHWAATGERTPKYASAQARQEGIDAGAGRPAAELLVDLTAACERLDAALAALPADRREVPVEISGTRPEPARLIVTRRMQEVEIHHVDLALAHTPAHWPLDFVVWSLDLVAADLSGAQHEVGSLRGLETGLTWPLAAGGPERHRLSGPERALLAWLTGRSDGDGLHLDGAPAAAPVPPAPAWT